MKHETAVMDAVREGRRPAFDVARIRRDFPILDLKVNGKPLVFLDNAASSQMPKPVQSSVGVTRTDPSDVTLLRRLMATV